MTTVTRLPRSMARVSRECVLRAEPAAGARELARLSAGVRLVVIHEKPYGGYQLVGWNGGTAFVEAEALAEEV